MRGGRKEAVGGGIFWPDLPNMNQEERRGEIGGGSAGGVIGMFWPQSPLRPPVRQQREVRGGRGGAVGEEEVQQELSSSMV